MTDSMFLTLGQTASDQMMTGGAPAAAPVAGTAAPGTAAPAGTPMAPQGGGMMGILIPLTLFMVVLIFFQIMGQRRDKKRRDALISGLKRGDKVLTIGGQLGVVEQVKDNEVVLKVDEFSNAKARFTKAAIQQVLESGPGGDAPAIEVKASNDKFAAAR